MSLKALSLPPVLDTSGLSIIDDFFEPVLGASVKYDRGVGYFSAGWLRIASKGMSAFARNGGRARWITSPILNKDDWEAMLSGVAARQDEALHQVVQQNIVDLEHHLETATLSALAWLVADNILDFKLALPRDKLEHGEFHDKFGVFTDQAGDRVSFHGSYNDSIQGTRNYESISIFYGWEDAHKVFVEHTAERFEKLWHNQDPNVRVYSLPEAARAQILKLRTQSRPYPPPSSVRGEPNAPAVPPELHLRDYQQEAIQAWFDNGCRGLLEMATGTGKTITALAASVRLYRQNQRLALIITVPYQHLVDQWNDEASAFGYQPVLAYKSKARWLHPLNERIGEFNAGHRDVLAVITTHTTFASDDFQRTIARLSDPAMLLADEAHHLGAERSRTAYPNGITKRLALSATPNRWFDEEGTAALRAFFGETVFSFSLEQAIGVSLTPYYYYPHLVLLSDDEMERYEDLSSKIAKVAAREDEEGQEILRQLLIKRATLLNRAEGKIGALSALLDQQGGVSHTLFYCAPKQIDEVLKLVGWEKGIIAHRFTAEESTTERQRLLEAFSKGEISALVAMKCLDEGVDVPSTQMAFFLASSSNPREFIQRRGRILRKAPNKAFSVIHDLIAVPSSLGTLDPVAQHVERSIVKRELHRFSEFADLATNKYEARDAIWELAKHYGLADF